MALASTFPGMLSAWQEAQHKLVLAALVVIFHGAVNAQVRTTTSPNTTPGSINGKVLLPNGGYLTESTRIRLETSRGVSASVFTDPDGKFQFTDLTPGSYQVVVDGDNNRFETTTQRVEVVRGMLQVITIILN